MSYSTQLWGQLCWLSARPPGQSNTFFDESEKILVAIKLNLNLNIFSHFKEIYLLLKKYNCGVNLINSLLIARPPGHSNAFFNESENCTKYWLQSGRNIFNKLNIFLAIVQNVNQAELVVAATAATEWIYSYCITYFMCWFYVFLRNFFDLKMSVV